MAKEANRKLAAIMFADIVGYSRMMGANEKEALKIVTDFDSISIPIVEKFNGVLIKKNGDEIFCEFSSAKNAVDASVEIQNKLASYNDSRPKDFKLEVRIGIHIGDVVKKDNDIFGDGVNVAARIQPLAAPGGICVSGAVSDALSSHPDYDIISKGKQELKHIVQQHSIFDIKTGHERKTKSPISKGSRNKFLSPVNILMYTLILTVSIYFLYNYIYNQETDRLQQGKKKIFISKVLGDSIHFDPKGEAPFEIKGYILAQSEDESVKSILSNDNVELKTLSDSKKMQIYDEMLSGLDYNSTSYTLESHYDYSNRCKSKGESELNYTESAIFDLVYYIMGRDSSYNFTDFLHNSYKGSLVELIDDSYDTSIMPIVYEVYDGSNPTGKYVVSIVQLSFEGNIDGTYTFAIDGRTFSSDLEDISQDLFFHIEDFIKNYIVDDPDEYMRVSAINNDEIIFKFTKAYRGMIKERMILNAQRNIIITEFSNRDSIFDARYAEVLKYKNAIDKDVDSDLYHLFYDISNPAWSQLELNSLKTGDYFPYETGSLSVPTYMEVKVLEVYDSTATAKIYSKDNPYINIKVGDFLTF